MRFARFDNDGVNYDDGLRLVTEGALTLSGVRCFRVGIYRQRGEVYVRPGTVYPDRRLGAESMRADKLRSDLVVHVRREHESLVDDRPRSNGRRPQSLRVAGVRR